MKLPQLYIRDLFWLVLVAALALGWLLRERQLSRKLENYRGMASFLSRVLYQKTHDKVMWSDEELLFNGTPIPLDGD